MPPKSQNPLSGLRVGILVLIALTILVATIFVVAGDIPFFRKKTYLHAYMPTVEGLRKGAEVRLSGVKVGNVKEINFNRKIPDTKEATDNIEIVMEISGKLNGVEAIERIRSDSIAILKGAGVLGDNIIDISPGTTKGQPMQNNGTVQSYANKSVGDIINASQTAMSNLNTITDNIKDVTANIKAGEGSVGRFLKDDTIYINLNKAVLQAETLISSIKKGNGTAGKLISDPAIYNQANDLLIQFRGVSDQIKGQLAEVRSGKGTVGKLLNDDEIYNRANNLMTKFDSATQKLEGIIARVEKGEGTVGKLLNEDLLYQEVRESIASFKNIAANLEKGEGTAGKLLKDETLYKNLNDTTAEMTKLLYDVRQNPKKYLDIKVKVF